MRQTHSENPFDWKEIWNGYVEQSANTYPLTKRFLPHCATNPANHYFAETWGQTRIFTIGESI